MSVSSKAENGWLAKWLDAVHEGSITMSQRERSAIDKHGGIAGGDRCRGSARFTPCRVDRRQGQAARRGKPAFFLRALLKAGVETATPFP